MISGQRYVTAKPPIAEITSIIEGETSVVENQAARPDPAPEFGRVGIFDTLIALPTPTPTPAPTQAPDPPLDEALKSWKVLSVYKNEATVTDIRTRDTFFMYTDRSDETRIVRHRNVDMEIKLESINDDEFSATFRYDGPAGVQRYKLGMFDQPQ
ncbi:MAG: hypothetical protein ACFCU1_09590 [Sumerlaeia bacterium]